jgi:hypothetical protein
VDVIDVDPLGLEALQRLLDLANDVPAVVARVVHMRAAPAMHFGREDNAVAQAAAGHPVADDRFGFSVVVDVGGVDEIPAELDIGVEDALRLSCVGASAEVHGAEAERSHLDAGSAEDAIVHSGLRGCEGESMIGAAARRSVETRDTPGAAQPARVLG